MKPDVFLKCELIAGDSDIALPKVIGALGLIWHKSQALGMTRASKGELRAWTTLTPQQIDAFIEQAIKERVRFLEAEPDGMYRIVGNEREVKRVADLREMNQMKAALRWANEKKSLEAKLNAAGMPTASRQHAEAMPEPCRGDALDLNIDQPRKSRRKKPASDTPAAVGPVLNLGPIAGLNPGDKPDFALHDKSDNARVWDAYSAAYAQRYGEPPPSSAMGYGLCKQLVKRIGVQPAAEVARFYLTVNKRWYVENLHPLSSAVKDAEALHTQMVTGRTMTATQAQQADQTQSNIDATQGAMDILMGRKGSILVTRE